MVCAVTTVLMFLFLLSRRPSEMIDYIPFTNSPLVEVMKKSELIIQIWPVTQSWHLTIFHASPLQHGLYILHLFPPPTFLFWHFQYYLNAYLDLLRFMTLLSQISFPNIKKGNIATAHLSIHFIYHNQQSNTFRSYKHVHESDSHKPQ